MSSNGMINVDIKIVEIVVIIFGFLYLVFYYYSNNNCFFISESTQLFLKSLSLQSLFFKENKANKTKRKKKIGYNG